MKLREIVIVFLLTSLVPFARASILPNNCNQFNDWQQQDCQSILSDASLSTSEKEDLYLNLLANQSKLPAHDFAWNWNQAITWASIPENVLPASNGIIENAWVKITAINKSFFDLNKNQWFFASQGRVLVDKNYSIELPQGPLPGDCRTDYSFELEEESLSVKLNATQIGNSRISNYSTSLNDGAPMVFSASYFVKARLSMLRYQNITTCYPGDRWNICRIDCSPYQTDYRVDSVSASDSFEGKARVENPVFSIAVEPAPLNKVFLSIDSVAPINFFELWFGDKFFSFGESVFDLNSSDGVVFVTRNNALQKELQGLLELDSNVVTRRFVFGTPSIENCSVRLLSSFEEKNLPCDLVELKRVVLGVETDANTYDFNQQINATIMLVDGSGAALANKKLLLRAKESMELVTDSSGTAQVSVLARDSKGVIAVDFLGDNEFASGSAVKRVALFDSLAFGTAEQAAGFFGAYYFIFLIAKKLWMGI